jgi:hypothetical protein
MNRFALTRRLVIGLVPLLTAPLVAQVPTLTAALTRTVSGDFSYVGSMVIGADGAVLVSQPSDARLLLVTGAPEPKVIGRRGAGPNEFQSIDRAGVTGGRFWAYDGQLRRITFIEPSGGFGPSQPLEGLAGKPALRGFVVPSPVGVVTPDSLLVAASAEGSGMLGMIELAERHFLITGAGQLAMREVARRAAAPNCAVIRGNAVWRIGGCTVPQTATRPDGRQLVIADVAFGGKPMITITSTTLSGVKGYTLTLPFTPRPIPSVSRESSRAEMQKLAAGAQLPPFPEFYDPIAGLIVSSKGEVWLTESAPRGQPRTLWRISTTGKVLGKVTLANFTLEAASGDVLWGTTKDADDVVSLVQYRVK